MVVLVKIFGALVVFMGLVALVSQGLLRRWLLFWQDDAKLRLAVLLRLAMGAVLFTASPQCQLPGVILILGVIIFISGVAGMILGPKRVRSMVKWFSDLPRAAQQGWALVAVAVGGLILYAS